MKKIVILFVIFLSQIALAQDFELIRHQVKMGETVKLLSQRYKIAPSEIYRLNKFAVDGVRQGMVLQLLVPKKEESIVEETVDEPVAEQPVAEEPQPEIVEAETPKPKSKGKKAKTDPVPQPVVETTPVPEPQVQPEQVSPEPQPGLASGETVEHTVAAKETLYSLSRKYGVSVDEIKRQNEKALKRGLQTGQVLTIRRD